MGELLSLMPEAIPATATDLTRALREAATLQRGSVEACDVTLRHTSSVSHLWFLEVTYSADCLPALPRQLVVKWPLPEMTQAGSAELAFYRDVAPAVEGPPLVRCLATAPASAGSHWLILEDLRSTHTNPPWPDRPTDEDVEAAVIQLARFHARWWEATALGTTIGELHTETSLRTMVQGIAAHLPRFFTDLGDSLPASDKHTLERVFKSSLAPWLRLIDRRALTVIHGDAHTWNFLFPRSKSGSTYIIDWQVWHLDVGARDLAFMIALHWDSATRRNLEPALLQLYHRTLVSRGVSGYTMDDLWLDYRRCVVRNLTFPIILWARGLAREAWRGRLDCALTAYRELDGADLL